MNVTSLIIRGIELALVAAIVFLCVRAVILFLAPSSGWISPNVAAPVMSAHSAPEARKFTSQFDPFHRDKTDKAVASTLGETAPETTLNLKVRGRRFSEYGETSTNGSATIETPDGTQAVYMIGDDIMRGVTLEGVERDYIVLSQNGRLERLTVAKDQTSTLAAVKPTTPDRPNLSSLQNLDSVLAGINLEPVLRDGQSQGLRISAKTGGPSLRDYGLQNGDILTHIGDRDLTQGVPEIAPLIQSLSSGNPVNIRVKRDNRDITIKLGL